MSHKGTKVQECDATNVEQCYCSWLQNKTSEVLKTSEVYHLLLKHTLHGRDFFICKFTVVLAIKEIDHQADDEPDNKTQPIRSA